MSLVLTVLVCYVYQLEYLNCLVWGHQWRPYWLIVGANNAPSLPAHAKCFLKGVCSHLQIMQVDMYSLLQPASIYVAHLILLTQDNAMNSSILTNHHPSFTWQHVQQEIIRLFLSMKYEIWNKIITKSLVELFLVQQTYLQQCVLSLRLQATLVGFTTDETEKRVLYQYLAEASVRFPQVFPVVYNLLETKVIEHLKYRYIRRS